MLRCRMVRRYHDNFLPISPSPAPKAEFVLGNMIKQVLIPLTFCLGSRVRVGRGQGTVTLARCGQGQVYRAH